jgi:acid phosphatase
VPQSGVPILRGQLVGIEFASAAICLDSNGNGRCDRGEPTTAADATGSFALPGAGTLVAEGVTGPKDSPVHLPIVLRAPAGANAVLSPISTELVALMEADGSTLDVAIRKLAKRAGVPASELLLVPDLAIDSSVREALQTETAQLIPRIIAAVAAAGLTGDLAVALRNRLALDSIETIVVIYAENRAFDTLYGLFPGANGIPGVNPSSTGAVYAQRDFDGSVLPVLPPSWGGVTAGGQPITVTQAQSTGMPNRPFRIDDPNGINGNTAAIDQTIVTRDLVHRYFSNQLQINGGRNDGFAAYSDAGGLSMGYYDGSRMKLWSLAQRYTLADNFFMGAFGGSFLNHQYLICACAPTYPNADAPHSPARGSITQIELDPQGRFKQLVPANAMPTSALFGRPRYKQDGTLTPKDSDGMFYAVNTMQPAYQPSDVPPRPAGDKRYADSVKPTTLPPQTQATIGDRLDAKGVSWAWYAGGWNAVNSGSPRARKLIYGGSVQFQTHHQPFNYFAAFDPATHEAARHLHLKDFDTDFVRDAAAGQLPAVTFYKPQGNLNQHAGYANIADGDAHIAKVIESLQRGPQWNHMLIIVTYDENGGFYDHAPVPAADRWGPGSRIPALLISPYVRKGFVDKTLYDTGSILRLITHRWSLAPLPGVTMRDDALIRRGSRPMGDLTGALDFTR